MACLNHPNADYSLNEGIVRQNMNTTGEINATIERQHISNHITREMFDTTHWFLVWHESLGDNNTRHICQKCAELEYNQLINESN